MRNQSNQLTRLKEIGTTFSEHGASTTFMETCEEGDAVLGWRIGRWEVRW